MPRAVLHLEEGVSLETIGRREEVLNEAKQVLATAQLCVETVLSEYGDDGGDLEKTAETLRQWKRAADNNVETS